MRRIAKGGPGSNQYGTKPRQPTAEQATSNDGQASSAVATADPFAQLEAAQRSALLKKFGPDGQVTASDGSGTVPYKNKVDKDGPYVKMYSSLDISELPRGRYDPADEVTGETDMDIEVRHSEHDGVLDVRVRTNDIPTDGVDFEYDLDDGETLDDALPAVLAEAHEQSNELSLDWREMELQAGEARIQEY